MILTTKVDVKLSEEDIKEAIAQYVSKYTDYNFVKDNVSITHQESGYDVYNATVTSNLTNL